MSRAIALALFVLAACGDDAAETETLGGPIGRFEAVKATRRGPQLDAFCDVRTAPDAVATARAFAWPPLSAATPAPAPATTWRWINVWATWCEPCIEEMPRIVGWKDRLARDGVPVDLVLLSADASDDVVTRWRAAHAGTPESLRLSDPGQMSAFFQSVGLDAAPPIPIHVFVDPQQRVRCARAGAINDDHYAAVAAILRGQ